MQLWAADAVSARAQGLVVAARSAARVEGDLGRVLAAVSEGAGLALGVGCVRVWRPTADARGWAVAAGGPVGAWSTVDGPEIVSALATGGCVVLDAITPKPCPTPASRAAGPVLAVPVARRNELIGFVTAEAEEARAWSADERALAVVLAEFVTLAIEGVEAREADAERRAGEERQREQRRAETVARLAGGIAHDVNNALTGVLGWAERVRRSGGPDGGRIAVEIERCVARAGALTHRLLAIGRRQVLSPVALDVNTVLARGESRYRTELGPDVPLEFKFEATQPIHADEGSVEEVLRQLIANARDAVRGGGAVRVRTVDAGGGVLVEVTDTGYGMPPDVAARAFEPFFSTKPAGGGVGLGLAVAEGLVRQGGGDVRLETALGRGTTVRVWWPAARAAYVTPPVAPPRMAADAAPRSMVLLVEDEPDLRRLVASYLRQRGHIVVEAEDGQAALDQVLPLLDRIDVVVTDVVMPRVDGRELARRLRARRADLPILYVSGWVAGDAAFRLEAGERFLAKPFTMGALSGAVGAILGDRAPQRAET